MIKLALGTVQFGLDYGVANKIGQMSQKEAEKVVQLARTAGIDTLDTAISYGQSEQVLGELGVAGFRIITKLPGIPEGTSDVEDWVRIQLAASCKRMGLDAIHAVLLHRSKDLLGDKGVELVEVLQRLKQTGLVEKIGVSIYDPDELDPIAKVIGLDLVQAPLNLVDRRLETSGWLSRLHAEGVEVHTRSSFLQGLLLMPRNEIPQRFERWSALWDSWHHTLADIKITATQACLSYPVSLPEVSRVVVGVDSKKQLQELITSSQSTVRNHDFSFLNVPDTDLINPSRWNQL